MKARTFNSKLAWAMCAVVSLSMVTTGCKSSGKKKAAVATATPTPIPPVVTPPITSTSTAVAVPVGGVTCETKPSALFGGGTAQLIKIDEVAKRMSITEMPNGSAVYYNLTPAKDWSDIIPGRQVYSAVATSEGLGSVTAPATPGKVAKFLGYWSITNVPFLPSKTGQAQSWSPANIKTFCR